MQKHIKRSIDANVLLSQRFEQADSDLRMLCSTQLGQTHLKQTSGTLIELHLVGPSYCLKCDKLRGVMRILAGRSGDLLDIRRP